jgi:L-asparaginase II
MLAHAHSSGWPAFGYERQEHPVQRDCLNEVAKWTGLDASDIVQSVDGCGCVEFAVPLDSAARAYARLADAARRSTGTPARIVHAMQTRPFLVGGTDRFDSALIEATEGRVIAKIGAEGVHSVAVIDDGIGVTVKVEDGAQRAQFPAVLATLQHLGVLPQELPPRLAEFRQRPLRNSRGEIVGEIRPASARPRG